MPDAVPDEILPELDERYELSQAQLERYREQGFIRLEDVLSAQLLARYEAEITRCVRDYSIAGFLEQVARDCGTEVAEAVGAGRANEKTRPQPDTYRRAFTQRINLWRRSSLIETLVRSKRLAGIAAELMGVDGVRLYHDQALYKEAHGGHTPWHADQFYWPLSNDNTITAWIPLQAVPANMGPLCFAVGSHVTVRDTARNLAISDASEALLAAQLETAETDEAPFALGEVSFHSGWTCHRAGPNTTDSVRAAFTIIYMDQHMRMIEPAHRNHQMDAALWLPGVRPGDLAASPINPILSTSHPGRAP